MIKTKIYGEFLPSTCLRNAESVDVGSPFDPFEPNSPFSPFGPCFPTLAVVGPTTEGSAEGS